jgi:hypothetical protein
MHHRAEGAECQDSSVVRYIGDGSGGSLVACVADGAGSTTHGGEGARLACESIVESAAAHYADQGTLASLQPDDALSWCAAARSAIAAHAETHERRLRDYASTLLAAVISAEQTIFFQIGDGAIVVRRSGVLGVVFWPKSGEYVNTTDFLTSDDFRGQIQVCAAPGEFTDVALFTDGLERLALQFNALTPHAPFFNPLFGVVRGGADAASLTEGLRQFLQSGPVEGKNDDDKTLLLACRVADGVRHAD